MKPSKWRGSLPKTKAAAFREQAVSRNGFPDLDLLDPSWESSTPEQRIDLAVRTEAAALSTDKAITNSEGASFEYARSSVALANTLGFNGAYEGTGCWLVLRADRSVERRHAARSLDVGRQASQPNGIAGRHRQESRANARCGGSARERFRRARCPSFSIR